MCQGLVRKKSYGRFRHIFSKLIKDLEKNLLKCCDPDDEKHVSRYRKSYYELPDDFIIPKFGAGKKGKEIKVKRKNLITSQRNLLKNMGTSKN